MTARVLKQDPNIWKVQENAISLDKNAVCKFSGVIPLWNYKTTLKQQLNGEKRRKKRWKAKPLLFLVELCGFPQFVLQFIAINPRLSHTPVCDYVNVHNRRLLRIAYKISILIVSLFCITIYCNKSSLKPHATVRLRKRSQQAPVQRPVGRTGTCLTQ